MKSLKVVAQSSTVIKFLQEIVQTFSCKNMLKLNENITMSKSDEHVSFESQSHECTISKINLNNSQPCFVFDQKYKLISVPQTYFHNAYIIISSLVSNLLSERN